MELIEVKTFNMGAKGETLYNFDEGGPLLSISSIKLGLLKENDK
jgi:hypothetical protein